MEWIKRPPRAALLAAFWVAVVAIGVMSLLPQEIPMPSTGWDKSNHALAFLVLGWMGTALWPPAPVLLGLAAYGGAIEVAQTFTQTRFGDWIDWVADLAGLAVAAAWHAIASRRARKGTIA